MFVTCAKHRSFFVQFAQSQKGGKKPGWARPSKAEGGEGAGGARGPGALAAAAAGASSAAGRGGRVKVGAQELTACASTVARKFEACRRRAAGAPASRGAQGRLREARGREAGASPRGARAEGGQREMRLKGRMFFGRWRPLRGGAGAPRAGRARAGRADLAPRRRRRLQGPLQLRRARESEPKGRSACASLVGRAVNTVGSRCL